MADDFVNSDGVILDLLRDGEAASVTELAAALHVTATAVRQRLNRLMAQGCVERSTRRRGRGRPQHRYGLTAKGRLKAGVNFPDLAIAIWKEVRSLGDMEVQGRLLDGVSRQLAGMYAGTVHGESVEDRMRSLAGLFTERRIPFAVESADSGPRLKALACPYPELADQDRGICNMERRLFTHILGEDVQLDHCRLDGGHCCQFAVGAANRG